MNDDVWKALQKIRAEIEKEDVDIDTSAFDSYRKNVKERIVDYTQWRIGLFEGLTGEEISRNAMQDNEVKK